MDLGIRGRVALVLGASGGLGQAIVRALAQEGGAVAAAGRDAQILEQVTRVERELGPVDILINNTGGPPPGPASGVAPRIWAEQFQLMVGSVISITDRIVVGMRSRGWGRIITSTSSGIVAPIPNLALSNSLRMALGWSKTLAREVARDGITVNIVIPGRIDTRRVRTLDAPRAQREGRPEEYAEAVAFLASASASYITGSTLRVDGGMIASI